MDAKYLLKRLVQTESPSHVKAAVDRVGAIVVEEARKLGAQVEIIPNQETGDHVLSRFHASDDSLFPSSPILLLCHMDTVFPLETDLRVEWGTELIHGPGLGDNSMGVAALFGLLWSDPALAALALRDSK